VWHLDLFSGIGGFAIAAQRMGWRTVGFHEIDPFCLRVLNRRFPDCDRWVPMPGHLGSGTPHRLLRVTEFSRLEPDWLVLENDFHRWRAWMPELRRRLYRLGYSSLPLRVRAAEVGAVHIRARGWLVAHAHCEPLRELSRWWSREGGAVAQELASTWDSAPRGLGTNHGLSAELDLLRGLVDAEGRYQEAIPEARVAVWKVLRSMWLERELAATSPELYLKRLRDCLPDVPHGNSRKRWLLGKRIEADKGLRDLWEAFCSKPFEEAQDLQRRVLERAWKSKRPEEMGSDEDRRHALGNAIVPRAAELIFHGIKQVIESSAKAP